MQGEGAPVGSGMSRHAEIGRREHEDLEADGTECLTTRTSSSSATRVITCSYMPFRRSSDFDPIRFFFSAPSSSVKSSSSCSWALSSGLGQGAAPRYMPANEDAFLRLPCPTRLVQLPDAPSPSFEEGRLSFTDSNGLFGFEQHRLELAVFLRQINQRLHVWGQPGSRRRRQ